MAALLFEGAELALGSEGIAAAIDANLAAGASNAVGELGVSEALTSAAAEHFGLTPSQMLAVPVLVQGSILKPFNEVKQIGAEAVHMVSEGLGIVNNKLVKPIEGFFASNHPHESKESVAKKHKRRRDNMRHRAHIPHRHHFRKRLKTSANHYEQPRTTPITPPPQATSNAHEPKVPLATIHQIEKSTFHPTTVEDPLFGHDHLDYFQKADDIFFRPRRDEFENYISDQLMPTSEVPTYADLNGYIPGYPSTSAPRTRDFQNQIFIENPDDLH